MLLVIQPKFTLSLSAVISALLTNNLYLDSLSIVLSSTWHESLRPLLVTLCWDSWGIPSAGASKEPSGLGLIHTHKCRPSKSKRQLGTGGTRKISLPPGEPANGVRSVSDWKIPLLEEQTLLWPCHFQKSSGAAINSYFKVVMGSSGFGTQQAWIQSHLPALWLQAQWQHL